jgi:hypothetical protein
LGRAAEEDAMDADDEDELADDDDGDELGEEEEEGDYEDDDTAHPFSNLPPSSSAVHTGVMVVSHSGDSGAEVQLGDPVEVICGFRNAGAEALTVTHVLGSLSNPVRCLLGALSSVWRRCLLLFCAGMYGGVYGRLCNIRLLNALCSLPLSENLVLSYCTEDCMEGFV